MRDARRPHPALALLVFAGCGVGVACAGPTYEEHEKARAAYHACLEEHPDRPEECDDLRELVGGT